MFLFKKINKNLSYFPEFYFFRKIKSFISEKNIYFTIIFNFFIKIEIYLISLNFYFFRKSKQNFFI